MGIEASIAAATLGACIIERHITEDKTQKGPDHPASLEPKELNELIIRIRALDEIMGSSSKKYPEL